MTWPAIIHRDWQLLLGARITKVTLVGFIGVMTIAAYLYPVIGTDPITSSRFANFVNGWLETLLPAIGVLFGYGAIARERKSGALRLALSMPHTRRTLMIGRFASRATVLAISIVAGMLISAVLIVYPFGKLEPGRFVLFALLTVVYGAVWVGIGVASSASVGTDRRALMLSVGMVLLIAFLWDVVIAGAEAVLVTPGVIDGPLETVVQLGAYLDPGSAFETLISVLILNQQPAGPWYNGVLLALPVLIGWLVSPLTLALIRFERRDLS